MFQKQSHCNYRQCHHISVCEKIQVYLVGFIEGCCQGSTETHQLLGSLLASVSSGMHKKMSCKWWAGIQCGSLFRDKVIWAFTFFFVWVFTFFLMMLKKKISKGVCTEEQSHRESGTRCYLHRRSPISGSCLFIHQIDQFWSSTVPIKRKIGCSIGCNCPSLLWHGSHCKLWIKSRL